MIARYHALARRIEVELEELERTQAAIQGIRRLLVA